MQRKIITESRGTAGGDCITYPLFYRTFIPRDETGHGGTSGSHRISQDPFRGRDPELGIRAYKSRPFPPKSDEDIFSSTFNQFMCSFYYVHVTNKFSASNPFKLEK